MNSAALVHRQEDEEPFPVFKKFLSSEYMAGGMSERSAVSADFSRIPFENSTNVLQKE
jgi:hypothetical protein